MNALLIIDMQVGSFEDAVRYDAQGVIQRINDVAAAIRRSGGLVVFIQHQGPPGDRFAVGQPGWEILPDLEQAPQDRVVAKTACDAFYKTELEAVLRQQGVDRLLISGCATDFCVDTTFRAAASRDFDITVLRDGHTTADREHLPAEAIIEHHNRTWAELIVPDRQMDVVSAAQVLERCEEAAESSR